MNHVFITCTSIGIMIILAVKKENLAANLRYCMIVCLMISHKSHLIYVKLIAVSHLNIERKYCHVQ